MVGHVHGREDVGVDHAGARPVPLALAAVEAEGERRARPVGCRPVRARVRVVGVVGPGLPPAPVEVAAVAVLGDVRGGGGDVVRSLVGAKELGDGRVSEGVAERLAEGEGPRDVERPGLLLRGERLGREDVVDLAPERREEQGVRRAAEEHEADVSVLGLPQDEELLLVRALEVAAVGDVAGLEVGVEPPAAFVVHPRDAEEVRLSGARAQLLVGLVAPRRGALVAHERRLLGVVEVLEAEARVQRAPLLDVRAQRLRDLVQGQGVGRREAPRDAVAGCRRRREHRDGPEAAHRPVGLPQTKKEAPRRVSPQRSREHGPLGRAQQGKKGPAAVGAGRGGPGSGGARGGGGRRGRNRRKAQGGAPAALLRLQRWQRGAGGRDLRGRPRRRQRRGPQPVQGAADPRGGAPSPRCCGRS